mgnify:CR=1 FL=1
MVREENGERENEMGWGWESGWPRKERFREEDTRRPRRRVDEEQIGTLPLEAINAAVADSVRARCSTCGKPGHNKRRQSPTSWLMRWLIDIIHGFKIQKQEDSTIKTAYIGCTL